MLVRSHAALCFSGSHFYHLPSRLPLAVIGTTLILHWRLHVIVRRLSFEDALQHKWSTAMASAILTVRSSGVRRRLHSTNHTLPLTSVLFPRGKGGVIINLASIASLVRCRPAWARYRLTTSCHHAISSSCT